MCPTLEYVLVNSRRRLRPLMCYKHSFCPLLVKPINGQLLEEFDIYVCLGDDRSVLNLNLKAESVIVR